MISPTKSATIPRTFRQMRTLLACLLGFTCLLTPIIADQTMAASGPSARPLIVQSERSNAGGLRVRLDRGEFASLKSGTPSRLMEFPVSATRQVTLDVTRFQVYDDDTRFFVGSPSGNVVATRPDVVMYRGTVAGEPTTHAYLAFSGEGMGRGSVTLENGETYQLSQVPEEAAKGWGGELTIVKQQGGFDLPDGVEFCGVTPPDGFMPVGETKEGKGIYRGLRLAKVAVEGDQEFYNLFGNLTSAQNYALMVMGEVSDIYIRDIKTKLLVKFVRIWPSGGEPFAADDIYGFRTYWTTSQPASQYNFVNLMSGRRDLSYGGVAFVGGTCSGEATYSVTGFLNGSFPIPFGMPSISNWDVTVVAHEMGHNSGSYHTHDGFTPTIDDCGNGVPSRGTILSYCHTFAGFTANIDLFMHRRVEEVIAADFDAGGCMPFDCNGNDTADTYDISSGRSDDINLDGIPDECQDCNHNGILDPADIGQGMVDINGNGVPDVCETDCNQNFKPDDWDIAQGISADVNGNDIPDECDLDCDNNGIPDFAEIVSGAKDDFDRNNIPDICQDCNENGVSDWVDLGRQRNLFIADLSDVVHEFHEASGYPIRNIGAGGITDPQDVVFGSDRQLYVSSYSNHRIVRLNVDSATYSTFVAAGSGGLVNPTGLVFGPNGNLYVSSRGTSSIIQYNGSTGALIGTFVTTGSGGLTQPYGLEFGPNGNLYVSSSNKTVIEYNGTTGDFVRVLVAVGSGGLNAPRGLAFKANGNLLVASNLTDQILEYNGSTGLFLGVFNDVPAPKRPWGLRIGPNGNVFAVESSVSSGTPIVIEYFPNGTSYRRYVRGVNNGLVNPTGMAFRPGSIIDCNGNGLPDTCDIASGVSLDLNHNRIPDECDGGDFDQDGVANGTDNCPFIANVDQADQDADAVGDACDNCLKAYNPTQADSNHNGIGDVCDFLCGDADGNKVVNISDAVYLVAYIFGGGSTPEPLLAGDADCNYMVNISDAVYLISYIFGGGAAPCAGC
jgi:hypothetical protein